MKQLSLRTWLISGVLAGAVTIAISVGIIAASQPPACGTQGSLCPFTGRLSAVSLIDSAVQPGAPSVSAPAGSAFGALVYADLKLVEQQARAKLQRGLKVRQAISPYENSPDFTQFVQNLDFQAGWSQDYTGTTPYTQTLTVIDLIDKADQDLRDARDIYAFLAVYALVPRFRSDTYYTNGLVNYNNLPLCGVTSQENPDPTDTNHIGLVLDPVIDWCDFPARLRQSVREAAQLRMIFGQEFMADALGGYFSGQFPSGDFLARQEEAKLQAAQNQYDLAEKGLAEALKISVGSGCLVSDFFQEPEWSLLSRIAESRETAQHEIAVRQSYLDISGPFNGASTPKELALNTFHQAATDGYLKLVGFAGLGDTSAPATPGCAQGTRPDGSDVAQMTLDMLNTRSKAHEMAAGRNIFGFDVSFTPDAPYASTYAATCDSLGGTTGNHGLWEDAWCAAKYAQTLQTDAVAAGRDYDNSQAALRTAVDAITTKIDDSIKNGSGCVWAGDDQALYDCVTRTTNLLQTCLQVVTSTTTIGGAFDTCMNAPALADYQGDAWQSLMDLRNTYNDYQLINLQIKDIDAQVNNSWDHNARVTKWLYATGTADTASAVADEAAAWAGCMDFSISGAVKDVGCTATGIIAGTAAATAGGISTQASVEMQNADTEQEVQGLLLQQSELLINAYQDHSVWLSKLSEFNGVLSDLSDDVIQARKQRAYFAHSPANDPTFRIVRDSARLQLAKALDKASRLAYLAGRRAEYEYAARLSDSGFRISDIYRARTAQDVLAYLSTTGGLGYVTQNLAGSQAYHTNADVRRVSVARDYLNLNNDALLTEGIPSNALTTTRISRFRAWVQAHTVAGSDGKPVLKFNMVTSVLTGGLWSRVILQSYDLFWLMKTAGIGDPKPSSNGVSVNIVTDQAGMSYRQTAVTQGGLVHMHSFFGCTFDYRLMAPAVLLGLEYASNQPADQRTAAFKANVNDTHAYTEPSYATPGFDGQAVSTTDWEMVLFSGKPDSSLSDMNLQQLSDIEIIVNYTYASRVSTAPPQASKCTRIDN